jgi:hypothetical protein
VSIILEHTGSLAEKINLGSQEKAEGEGRGAEEESNGGEVH